MKKVNATDMIEKCDRSIHQIEIFINPILVRPLMKHFLEIEGFKSGGQNKPKHKRNVRVFYFITSPEKDSNKMQIRVVRSDNRTFHFLCIVNPTLKFQRKLKKILRSVAKKRLGMNKMYPKYLYSITKVEFALDFYPKKGKSINEVSEYLRSGLNLNYARSCGHRLHRENTTYFGNNGYVHNGSHGLTIYPRPKDNLKYVRYEYIANKNRLKSVGLKEIKNLSRITPSVLCPFNFIRYREYSEHKIHESIRRKIKRKTGRQISTLHSQIVLHAHKNHFFHNNSMPDDKSFEISNMVDWYKKFRNDFGLSLPIERFFSTDEDKIRELKVIAGYIRS